MNLIEEYNEKYRIDPKSFAKKLEERTTLFAVKTIKSSPKHPGTPEEKIVRNQLTKAGTAIGNTTYKNSIIDEKRYLSQPI